MVCKARAVYVRADPIPATASKEVTTICIWWWYCLYLCSTFKNKKGIMAPIDGPQVIVLTDEERDSGVMSDKKLYDAIEAFFKDGLVVVENAIDVAIIDKLNTRMLQDTDKLLSGQGRAHYK